MGDGAEVRGEAPYGGRTSANQTAEATLVLARVAVALGAISTANREL